MYTISEMIEVNNEKIKFKKKKKVPFAYISSVRNLLLVDDNLIYKCVSKVSKGVSWTDLVGIQNQRKRAQVNFRLTI